MNKTIVLNDIEMSKKDFYDAKKEIPLGLVDTNNIVVSNKKTTTKKNKQVFDWLFT